MKTPTTAAHQLGPKYKRDGVNLNQISLTVELPKPSVTPQKIKAVKIVISNYGALTRLDLTAHKMENLRRLYEIHRATQ